LDALEEGPCSTGEILDKIGLGSRTGAFRRNLNMLIEEGIIEYTYPESPRYPKQKYRLRTGN
jgi:predicted transcriptional regulator